MRACMWAIAAVAVAGLASMAAAQGAAGLAGAWVQRSTGTELVLTPKIKLQPAIATTGFGVNLGGSVGYGSATNTTIVNEFQPTTVTRAMRLQVAADGGFRWTIEKTLPDGKTCTKTVRTEKQGRVTQAGGKASFAVSGGQERWSSTCGKSGQAAVAAATETYDLARTAAGLTLKGPGGVNWVFRKG